jgi:Fic family protein
MSATDNLDLLLAEIDLLKADLQLQCAEIDQALQQKLDISYSHDSLRLEGGSLDLAETEMVIKHGLMLPGKPMTDNLTALNHYQAIQFVREQAAEQNLLSASSLQKLHIMLSRGLQNQLGGAYRNQSVQLLNDEMAPAAENIQQLLAEQLQWLNREGPFLHPLVFAAEAHLRMLVLQPFQNNNGLCARLIMNLILLGEDYPIMTIASNTATKNAYIKAFGHAQTGKPLDWQCFIAEQIIQNFQNLLRLHAE